MSDSTTSPTRPDMHAAEALLLKRLKALKAGDLDRVMETYADDAVVILPSAVAAGKAKIRTTLEQMAALLGTNPPQLKSITGREEVWLVTYAVTGLTVSVPDGADTFVIRDGLVRFQTLHATPVVGRPSR